jgi:hypothetical protein
MKWQIGVIFGLAVTSFSFSGMADAPRMSHKYAAMLPLRSGNEWRFSDLEPYVLGYYPHRSYIRFLINETDSLQTKARIQMIGTVEDYAWSIMSVSFLLRQEGDRYWLEQDSVSFLWLDFSLPVGSRYESVIPFQWSFLPRPSLGSAEDSAECQVLEKKVILFENDSLRSVTFQWTSRQNTTLTMTFVENYGFNHIIINSKEFHFVVGVLQGKRFGKVEEFPDYYPLITGSWYYYEDESDPLYVVPPRYFNIYVGEDTLLPNGKVYKHVGSEFLRRDSIFIMGYNPSWHDYEYVAYFFPEPGAPVHVDFPYERWYATDTMTIVPIPLDSVAHKALLMYELGSPIFLAGVGLYRRVYDFGEVRLVGAVINGDTLGFFKVVSVKEEKGQPPTTFSLSQNYPNPFNPRTTINYELSTAGFVTLKVFDVLGREVATPVENHQPIGRYRVEYEAVCRDGSLLPSGVYFYQLRVVPNAMGNQQPTLVATRKMILLR